MTIKNKGSLSLAVFSSIHNLRWNRIWKNERIIGFVVVFVTSCFLMARQFLTYDFAACMKNDAITHMIWIRQFADALREGVLLPRWLPHSMGGYGSPVFIFYPPLVYYFAAPLYWLTHSLTLTIKIIRFVGFLGSGLAVWRCGRTIADFKPSIIMAIIVMVIPYHVLHSYYFAFIAETWGWIWIPLIVAYLIQYLQGTGDRRDILKLGGIYGCLILTHLISALLCTLIISIGIFACLMRKKTRIYSGYIFMALVIGLLLSAFYLFPAWYEQKLVHIEATTKWPIFSYSNNFLFFPNQMWLEVDSFFRPVFVVMQKIAGLQAMWFLSAVWIMYLVLKREMIKNVGWMFVFVLWGLSIFMMTRLSTQIWHYVPGLASIQFTFRWLVINSIAVSLVAGYALSMRRIMNTQRIYYYFHCGLGFVVVFHSTYTICGSCYVSYEYSPSCQEMAHNVLEYVPLEFPKWEEVVQFPYKTPINIERGQAIIYQVISETHRKYVDLESREGCLVDLKVAHYPGWEVCLDNRIQPFQVLAGSMAILVPPGRHKIDLRFRSTWWRMGSGLLSLCTLLGLITYLVYQRRKPESL